MALLILVVALLGAGIVAVPGGVNAQSSSAGTTAPIDIVQRHYADLAAGDYQAAWQLLSPSAQRQVDFSAWANSYASSRIEPSDLTVESRTGQSAVVVGSAKVTSSAGPSAVVQGVWTLTLADGEWRLESAILMSAVSAQR